MAFQYWMISAPGVRVPIQGNLLSIINKSSSSVLRVDRIGFTMSYVYTITGILFGGNISRFLGGDVSESNVYYRTVAAAFPTTAVNLWALPLDSDNTALSSDIKFMTGGYPIGTEHVFRRFIWSSDEPANLTATLDEGQTTEYMNVWYDAGYADSNVQKLAIRPGESLAVYTTQGSTATAAGLIDVWIEFNIEIGA